MKYIILPLILISHLVYSQSYFTSGYIILKNQTDTLKGQIDDQNWEINPQKVLFKSNTIKEKTYLIEELSAFGIINKDHYLVKKVDLDLTPFEISNLLNTPQLIIKKDTTLAFRIYLKADVSLLYLTDQSGKEHYFYSTFDETKELINHQYLKTKDEKNYVFTNKMFQKQIELLFSTCSKKIKINSLEFNQIQLVNKFIEFNDCLGCTSTCYVKSKIEKTKVSIGLTAGITQILDKEQLKDYFKDINQTNQYLANVPIFGINTNLYSKRKHGNNILTFELLYQIHKLRKFQSKYDTQINNIQFSALYKKRYFAESILKPFYGIGINYKVNFKPKINPFDNQFYSEHTKNQELILLESGIEFNKITLAARANINLFSNKISYLFYKNVAEVEVQNFQGRLGSQIMLNYKF